MRRGFTLIELLIVVVVLVTLMSIAFRLGSVGTDQSRRNNTVSRLHKLENCLSGYYAAFGTYPAVRLHGSRDYTTKVSIHGIQSMSDGDAGSQLNFSWYDKNTGEVKDTAREAEDWEKVKAACKAQPVGCSFPFPDNYSEYIDAVSEQVKDMASESTSISDSRKQMFAAGFDDGASQNIGRHNKGKNCEEWQEIQLFKFGLMSFLLPRYLIMMRANENLYEDFAQWTGNNSKPCNPLTGETMSWQQLRNYATSKRASDLARVANIPSQAVTARWMANLQDICTCFRTTRVFGVKISEGDDGDPSINTSMEVYAPSAGEGGEQTGGSTGSQYILDGVTVDDGWEHEFYYYCPAPYQSYVLWSGGKNDRTFPPWVAREKLDGSVLECVEYWTSDDIVGMSN